MRSKWLLLIVPGLGLLSACTAHRQDLRLTAIVQCWEKDDDSTRFSMSALDTAAGAAPFKADCSGKGKCRLDLPLDHVYRVEMTGEGHVPKHVMMDLNGPGIKQRKWGYDTRFTVQLMPRIDSVDYGICERPLAVASFNKKENQFVWDERYTYELTPYYEAMQNRYAEVMRRRNGEP